MYAEDYVMFGIGAFIFSIFAAIIAGIIWSVNIHKQPITVTKATENCVIIEQGGYKEFHCSNMVNVDSFNSDYMRE